MKSSKDQSLTSLRKMSFKDAAEGIMKCIENAESLYKDAELLEGNGSIPRALSLYIMSIEEISKVTYILTEVSFEPKSEITIETKKFIKRFKGGGSHKSKQGLGFMVKGALDVCTKGDVFKMMEYVEKQDPAIESSLEKARQNGFYVDFEDGKFYSPKELLSRDKYFSANEIKKLKDKIIHTIKDHREMVGNNLNNCIAFLEGLHTILNCPQEELESKLKSMSAKSKI